MGYKIILTKKFIKSLKKLSRSGSFDLKDFNNIVDMISNSNELPMKIKDHPLVGNWEGFRECHIKFDLLLIYQIYQDELRLVEIGSHSELFG